MCMYIAISLIACLFCVDGFNLEERLPLYKRGNANSTFGFSVAMHKTKNGPEATLDNSLLVIGSPTASALPSQKNTIDPGGIFYCPVTTTPDECTRIQMDTGPSLANNNKTNQWLGVSLKSQGPGKYLIACAHRYTERFGVGENEDEIVCGKCFLLNGTERNEVVELTPGRTGGLFIPSPCQNSPSYSKNTLAYTQAGVSVSWLGKEYLLGGPGAYAWSGAMFGYSMPEISPIGFSAEVTEQFETLGCNEGELRRTRTSGTKPKCNKIPLRRDSYMGFSVTTSDSMNLDGPTDGTYIAGSPRGNFTGAVVLYRKTKDASDKYDLVPDKQDVVMGEQIGSSFGFAVAATDINGDGLDDLLVGAPQYYRYSNEGKYGGALYVYINDPDLPFSQTKPIIKYGPPDSFFGYSITPLGDIDQDGYNDFAVGSPYDGSGKVHIYRGASGMFTKAQTLDGAAFTKLEPEMKGFGISMSGQVDIDNNKYPDVLIGTLKDQAILLRSRPVISVMATFEAIPPTIDLRKLNCDQSGTNHTCFNIKFCLSYMARHMEYTEALPIEYTIKLDSDQPKKLKRVRFSASDKTTKTRRITLPRSNDTECRTQKVYFSNTALNRLQPVAVDFDFSLVSEGKKITPDPPGSPIFPMIDDPVLNPDYPHEIKEIVNIFTNCGDDGCQSNLQVQGSVPPEIVVGNTNKVILSLNVSNTGEEAHQASVSVKLPHLVYYNNYSVVQPSNSDISCLTNEKGDSTFVECFLGNPYYSGSRDTIQIYLDVSFLAASTKNVTFEVKGSTTSENPVLPTSKLTTKIIVEMMLSLTGYGQPQQVRYSDGRILGSSAIVHTDEIGPLINHTFIIKNDGKQAANDVVLLIDFPYEIKNGKWLLYLVQTEVRGGGQTTGECTNVEVNSLGYKLPKARIREAAVAKRSKRDANTSPLYEPRAVVTPFNTKLESNLILNCVDEKARCVTINCAIAPIQNGTTVSVFLQSRLWNATFLEEFKNIDLVHIETLGKLSNKQSNVRIVGDQVTKKIDTTVDHTFFEEAAVNEFPWWYILIAIIAVLIIYCIIIFCLIRCGFFKRKRFPKQEREDQSDAKLIEEKPADKEDSL